MKRMTFLILAVVFIAMMTGCATFATNQDVPQATFPIIQMVPNDKLPQGEEIASFLKIAGFCLDYDGFVAKVRGRNYDVVEKTWFVFNRVYAIAK
jgi:hypothetical protein